MVRNIKKRYRVPEYKVQITVRETNINKNEVVEHKMEKPQVKEEKEIKPVKKVQQKPVEKPTVEKVEIKNNETLKEEENEQGNVDASE